MPRYRLRFLMQEIDLARGTTTVGRSPQCHVTLEDPLVSREHAQILIGEGGAFCEDLNSRNGVKLNGVAMRGRTALSDRDRVRIGAHELVFCEVPDSPSALAGRTTANLSHCARCQFPYPRELVSCSNCGSTEQRPEGEGEDTLTGQFDGRAQRSWSVQLLSEVVEKALTLGRVADAVRAMLRIVAQFEDRASAREPVDAVALDGALRLALRVTLAASDAGPTGGLLRLCVTVGHFPSLSAVELSDSVPPALRARLAVPAGALARSSGDAATTPERAPALAVLSRLALASAP